MLLLRAPLVLSEGTASSSHLFSDPASLAGETHLCCPHVLQGLFGQDKAEFLQSWSCGGPRGRPETALVLLHHLQHTWMHTNTQPLRLTEGTQQNGNGILRTMSNLSAS